MTALEEYLEHSGIKGMKWGVRRARNSVSLGVASHNRSKTDKQVKQMGKNLSSEKIADRVTGSGTSRIRVALGNKAHQMATKNVGKSMNKANLSNFQSHQSIQAAISRNQKTTSKLQQKVSKASGPKKAKAQANLNAWNAYSKVYSEKANVSLAASGKSYNNFDTNKRAIDSTRNKTINRVNKLYGANKHGDTNQALTAQAKNTTETARTGVKIAKAAAKAATGPQGVAVRTALKTGATIAAQKNLSVRDPKKYRGAIIN